MVLNSINLLSPYQTPHDAGQCWVFFNPKFMLKGSEGEEQPWKKEETRKEIKKVSTKKKKSKDVNRRGSLFSF